MAFPTNSDNDHANVNRPNPVPSVNHRLYNEHTTQDERIDKQTIGLDHGKIRCHKCNRQQNDSRECQYCGVIFSKTKTAEQEQAYHSGTNSAQYQTEDYQKALQCIEFGSPIEVIDMLGNVLSIPGKILFLSSKIDNHMISNETIAYIVEFITHHNLYNVKVRLNQFSPSGETSRMYKNKRMRIPFRIIFGFFTLLGYLLNPGRLFGGDFYNPVSDSVNIFSDHVGIALHELGHALDFRQRKYPGLYQLIRYIPLVALYQEYKASQYAIEFLREKKCLNAELSSYRILYPAYSTYVFGAIFELFPSPVLIGMYFPFIIAGHVLGYIHGAIRKNNAITSTKTIREEPLSCAGIIEKTLASRKRRSFDWVAFVTMILGFAIGFQFYGYVGAIIAATLSFYFVKECKKYKKLKTDQPSDEVNSGKHQTTTDAHEISEAVPKGGQQNKASLNCAPSSQQGDAFFNKLKQKLFTHPNTDTNGFIGLIESGAVALNRAGNKKARQLFLSADTAISKHLNRLHSLSKAADGGAYHVLVSSLENALTSVRQIVQYFDRGETNAAMVVANDIVVSFRESRDLEGVLMTVHRTEDFFRNVKVLIPMKAFYSILDACQSLKNQNAGCVSLEMFKGWLDGIEQNARRALESAKLLIDKAQLVLEKENDPDKAMTFVIKAFAVVSDSPEAITIRNQCVEVGLNSTKLMNKADLCLKNGRLKKAVNLATAAVEMNKTLMPASQRIIEKSLAKMRQRKKVFRLAMLSAVTSIVIVFIGYHFVKLELKNREEKKAYMAIIIRADAENDQQKKLDILSGYLKHTQSDEYANAVRTKMSNIRDQIADDRFGLVCKTAEHYCNINDYEKAIEHYLSYLKAYPNSRHSEAITIKLQDIETRIDDQAFQLVENQKCFGMHIHIRALMGYLEKYPDGGHRHDAMALILASLEEHYSDFKSHLFSLKEKENWEQAVTVCDEFMQSVAAITLNKASKPLRDDMITRVRDEREFAFLKAKVVLVNNDYAAMKILYEHYIDRNQNIALVDRARTELASVEIQLNAKIAWESTLNFVKNSRNSLDSRINALERFLDDKVSDPYKKDAEFFMAKLKTEKINFIRRLQLEKEQKAWDKQFVHANNWTLPLNVRITSMDRFITAHPESAFADYAQKVQKCLRIYYQEELKIKERISAKDGIYTYNDDGTISDKRTGLMWCAFDTYFERGKCVRYEAADDLISSIKYGGYSDWRLPSVEELSTIYDGQDCFPVSVQAEWYWTSQTEALNANTSSSRYSSFNRPSYSKSVYSDGGMASVVFSRDGKTGMVESSKGCGAFRGVRGPVRFLTESLQ